MVRLYPRNTQKPVGKLVVEEISNGIDVFYVPPEEYLAVSGFDISASEQPKPRLLRLCEEDDLLTIYPLNTYAAHPDFLGRKYRKVETIALKGFGYGAPDNEEDVKAALEDLPAAFVKDYDYGLGLQKDYRFIIEAIEEIPNIKHLVISKNEKTGFNGTICIISHKDFDSIRKKINNINSRAQSAARKIKSITAHNMLSFFLNVPSYPQKTHQSRDDALYRMISGEEGAELSKSDQEIVVKLITKNASAIAATQPETLAKIRNDIELVTLAELIARFEQMLHQKLQELRWQKLFNDNPFILSLAFGYPVIKIQGQAHVGGRTIEGSGHKITDFLVKNGISNNAALFEIKTPSTKLLNQKPYRDGIYTPSADLAGAINQMLDQKSKFQQEIATIKNNSRIHNLESYAVHGVLVVGQTPGNLNEQKSFELFRGNSKDITIVTFDELLEKLKQLHAFLSSNEKGTA